LCISRALDFNIYKLTINIELPLQCIRSYLVYTEDEYVLRIRLIIIIRHMKRGMYAMNVPSNFAITMSILYSLLVYIGYFQKDGSVSPILVTRLAYLTYLNERIHDSRFFHGDAASYKNILFRNFVSYFFHERSFLSHLYFAFVQFSSCIIVQMKIFFGNIEFIFCWIII